MKLYAPQYYKDFHCIADKCRHSCCIGWEIDVDETTLSKYLTIPHPYGKSITESIEYTGTPHFRLSESERCPHLDRSGLCRIITNVGEEYLCDICREHPRFYNSIPSGMEAGLGMSCEEACRIILSSDKYTDIIPIEDIPCASGSQCTSVFDSTAHRSRIYSLLSDRNVPYPDRLHRLYSAYSVSPAILPDAVWREKLSELEYLSPSHRELFSSYSSQIQGVSEWDVYLERALGYFIYRHLTPAEDADELRAALGFALFCERLLASMLCGGGDVFELARILSEEIEYSEENTEAVTEEFCYL